MVRPSSSASIMAETNRNNNNNNEDPKYRGVRKRKWGKWVSEIRLPNSRERIWLGSYDSPEKAARAFDAALFCLRGNTANFNFPHQPPNIPGGTELHPSQIQAVAADFANSFTSYSSRSSSSSQLLMQEDSTTTMMSTGFPTSMDVVGSASFMEDDYYTNNINNVDDHGNRVHDFEIFPGFDDYFMPQYQPPAAADYGEEVFDGVYPQDPSFLWNF